MLWLVCLTTFSLTQLSFAQILSLGQLGSVGSGINQRTVNLPNNNVIVANNGISSINAINTVPVPNVQLARQVPVNTVVANGNIGNANLVATNLASNNYAVSNFGSNLASGVVSANLVNNNVGALVNSNFGNNFVTKNLGTNLVNANLPINLANGFNINTSTFAVSNNGLASLLPVGRTCGIQIGADALEVGGLVGVNGQMPFYTTVNVNGIVPSSGSGVVNCACGSS